MITALAAVAGVTWIYLLHREQLAGQITGCPVPATAVVTAAAMEPFAPVAPAGIPVRVLNATDRSGLAAQIASGLQAQGFSLAAAVGNDQLHPRGSMRCVGQIRFGPNGVEAARTLSLVVPCAQLVRDDRADNTVDLALGMAFSTAHLEQTVLGQLPSPLRVSSNESGVSSAGQSTTTPTSCDD